MAGAQLGTALRQIQRLFSDGSSTGLSDTQLLDRFATQRDEAAFAAIVTRHGPMVLAVCRGVLRDSVDAEDAFQATFLVLARKARSTWVDGQLGGWLHKVAYRIAVRASAVAARRRVIERRVSELAAVRCSDDETDDELRPALHEELARLPAQIRLPIVLCYLEGRTHMQAAAELRCGEATLRRRLAQARERLRERLARRGFAPASAALTIELAKEVRAAVPSIVERTTLRAVLRVAAGEAVATVVGAHVANLTQGGLTLITHNCKATLFAAVYVAMIASLAGGVVAWDGQGAAPAHERIKLPAAADVAHPAPVRAAQNGKSPEPTGVVDARAENNWPLTLQDALRIAIDNSDLVHVFALSDKEIPLDGFAPTPLDARTEQWNSRTARLVIGPANSGASMWGFKADVMSHVRSVEQQYWNLAYAHVQRWASDRAVTLAQEILNRERAELMVGRGTVADVAEATQQLKQFKLDLATRTSDVITTERQLRDILGLQSDDNRRIIPVTPATEAKLDPDWDTCLAEMLAQSPEIVRRTASLKVLRDAIASATGLADPITAPMDQKGPNVANDQPEKHMQITQQETELKQTVHQQTHSLARFFLEIDAKYKQLQAAKRLSASATKRLDLQRTNHEAGRITIDRFLDSVRLHATAVATEAQYKTTYNISIVALKEAKGTLLEDYGIAVVEGIKQPRNPVANSKPDHRIKKATSEKPPTSMSDSDSEPIAPVAAPPGLLIGPKNAESDAINTEAIGPRAGDLDVHSKATPKVWSFSFSIGRDKPLLIKGTISEGADDRHNAADH
jgi:RNA polymerase sigma factor (sigma-70 family)